MALLLIDNSNVLYGSEAATQAAIPTLMRRQNHDSFTGNSP
jgi:hypothetical protein